MKKKILTMLLAVAMICTLIIGSASAASVSKTHEGYTAIGVLNWNSNNNGAYATSSYGTIADYLYARVVYTYTINGATRSTPGTNSGYSVQSISASASMAGSTKSSASSTHIFTENGSTWTTYLYL